MQKDSLIIAAFILLVVICLGLTFIPKLTNSVSDTSKKIKTRQIRVEQAVRA